MAFIPSAGGIEMVVTLRNSATNQSIVNVMHWFKPSLGVTDADLDAVLNYFGTSMWPQLRLCLASEANFVKATARDLSAVGGHERTLNTVTNPTGTNGSGALPGNCALALSWRAANTGRRSRGRSYIGIFSKAQTSADTISTALASALFTYASSFIGGRPTTQIFPAIRGPRDGLMTQVSAFVIDTILDTVRQRLENRGT